MGEPCIQEDGVQWMIIWISGHLDQLFYWIQMLLMPGANGYNYTTKRKEVGLSWWQN